MTCAALAPDGVHSPHNLCPALLVQRVLPILALDTLLSNTQLRRTSWNWNPIIDVYPLQSIHSLTDSYSLQSVVSAWSHPQLQYTLAAITMAAVTPTAITMAAVTLAAVTPTAITLAAITLAAITLTAVTLADITLAAITQLKGLR